MIETWIDELSKVWEINHGVNGVVKSYRLVEKAEFPSTIDASTLDNSPVALTIPGSMAPEYSEGGVDLAFWTGVTEFHVCSSISRGKLPALLPWYGKILRAAALHTKLNNKVNLFLINNDDNGIVGPVALQYGDEDPHWGFLVHWRVKESIAGQITFGR
jgi:hypothetical protein